MRANTREEYEARIAQVAAFILSNLDESPSPDEIADFAGFSRFHFGRVFAQGMREPLGEFVRRLRLERAAWQLAHSNKSVGEVAMDAGYSAVEAFTRAFRMAYKSSPSAFRKRPIRHETTCLSGVHWYPDGKAIAPRIALCEENLMEIITQEVAPMRLLAFRHVGPYHEIGPVFTRLWQWAGPRAVPMLGAIGVWHDDPDSTPAMELRSDAALIVPEDYEAPDEEGAPRVISLSGGLYAVTTHMGPYTGLSDAWMEFCGQAVRMSGLQPGAGPSFEIYVNDCSSVPPEEIRTDLYLPVARVPASVS